LNRRVSQSEIQVPDKIRCVDCLGECDRITFRPDDDPFEPGDVVAYRCRDCMDRWDIILDPEDFGDNPPHMPH